MVDASRQHRRPEPSECGSDTITGEALKYGEVLEDEGGRQYRVTNYTDNAGKRWGLKSIPTVQLDLGDLTEEQTIAVRPAWSESKYHLDSIQTYDAGIFSGGLLNWASHGGQFATMMSAMDLAAQDQWFAPLGIALAIADSGHWCWVRRETGEVLDATELRQWWFIVGMTKILAESIEAEEAQVAGCVSWYRRAMRDARVEAGAPRYWRGMVHDLSINYGHSGMVRQLQLARCWECSHYEDKARALYRHMTTPRADDGELTRKRRKRWVARFQHSSFGDVRF